MDRSAYPTRLLRLGEPGDDSHLRSLSPAERIGMVLRRDVVRVVRGRQGFILPSMILGLALLLAAIVFGLFHYRSRAARDTIQVTGAATDPFEADILKWRIVLSRQVPPDGLQNGYREIAADLERVLARLAAAGTDRQDVGVQPVNAYPNFDQFGNRVGYNLQQSLFVVSSDMQRLESLALNPVELIAEGIVIESSQLEYFYSKIDSLKHELLSQATADAKVRAAEIAGGSGLDVGGITSARAGVFQITEPYSTEVTDYGIHNTSTKKKEITVTVHATFLTD